MLIQFNFKNFKSFKDDTTLDLTATSITEYKNHVITIGNENILPVAAIFGANASGKTNISDAFKYMVEYVVHSLEYGGESSKKNKSSFVAPTPFLFSTKSRDACSVFEVYFIDEEKNGAKTYNYGFAVDKDGIQEEWLNYKTKSSRSEYKRIFYRNKDNIEFVKKEKVEKNIKTLLEKETLVVTLGSKLKISICKHVRDWFINNEFADFGRPIEDCVLSSFAPKDLASDNNVRDKVVKYISSFDPSIVAINVEVIKDEKEDEEKLLIRAVHKMIDSDETTSIPLRNESAGTLKMFALYPLLQNVLENGGVLFVDELNSRLHPLLVRAFVITFLNSEINTNHAQLIFTSHDSWQLKSNLLRRDEIWFTEKDDKGISSLYSLVDFVNEDGTKIRKDENYEKNYLLGKYGAIPTLKNFDMFKDEDR